MLVVSRADSLVILVIWKPENAKYSLKFLKHKKVDVLGIQAGLNHTLSWISSHMPAIHTVGQAANLVSEIHVKSNMPVANSILCHNSYVNLPTMATIQ